MNALEFASPLTLGTGELLIVGGLALYAGALSLWWCWPGGAPNKAERVVLASWAVASGALFVGLAGHLRGADGVAPGAAVGVRALLALALPGPLMALSRWPTGRLRTRVAGLAALADTWVAHGPAAVLGSEGLRGARSQVKTALEAAKTAHADVLMNENDLRAMGLYDEPVQLERQRTAADARVRELGRAHRELTGLVGPNMVGPELVGPELVGPERVGPNLAPPAARAWRRQIVDAAMAGTLETDREALATGLWAWLRVRGPEGGHQWPEIAEAVELDRAAYRANPTHPPNAAHLDDTLARALQLQAEEAASLWDRFGAALVEPEGRRSPAPHDAIALPFTLAMLSGMPLWPTSPEVATRARAQCRSLWWGLTPPAATRQPESEPIAG